MRASITLLSLFACLTVTAQTTADTVTGSKLKDAYAYLNGRGKPRDVAKAFHLFSECAEANDPRALCEVGNFYKKGQLVKPDRAKAEELFTKAAQLGYAGGWYNLGVLHKDESASKPDYAKAYQYFTQAASLGDEQSVYAEAYMHYKGLGCQQDYTKAAALFKHGALAGRPNSMYFYGLCWRNGYGTPANADSANYWLKKAASKKYGMAIRELATARPENDNPTAKAKAQQLKNVFDPEATALNRYQKITHQIQPQQVTGDYTGYMIRYDWSGEHAIGISPVSMKLTNEGGTIKGTWLIDDTLVVPIHATLTPQALVFTEMSLARKDHYSPKRSILYTVENARLQWQQKGNTIHLAGNVQMFSPQRNEPEKPIFLSLSRSASNQGSSLLVQGNKNPETLTPVKREFRVYPNPVSNVIFVDFELPKKSEVNTQLLTIDGKLLSAYKAGVLAAGPYTLPIHVKQLAKGTYVVKLHYGSQTKSVKVVKD